MKKRLKALVAIAFFFLSFSVTNAQVDVTFGPEIGGAISGTVEDGEATYAGFSGHVGGAAHVQIGRFFAVRPSVFFKTGTMYYEGDTEDKLKLSHVGFSLPVLFSYNFDNNNKVFGGAGPCLQYAIGGKFDEYGATGDIKFGTGVDDDMKPLDFGIMIKGGFQFDMGLALGLYFRNTIGNLRPNESFGKLQTMDAIGFSVGWMFGGNHDEKD